HRDPDYDREENKIKHEAERHELKPPFLFTPGDQRPRRCSRFLFTLPSSLFTLLFTLHSSLFTLHSSLFTLHSSLFTLHSSLFTLHSSKDVDGRPH
ncbi:MAG: hypothetical protein KY459_16135, partial [Acidobacteria bacterium]|nr:hypothetical protein [Acidobacteriota bacterium]